MPKIAANLTTLFTDVPLLERFARAKAAGFRYVEVLFPYDADDDTLAPQALVCGVEIGVDDAFTHRLDVRQQRMFHQPTSCCQPQRKAEFISCIHLTRSRELDRISGR